MYVHRLFHRAIFQGTVTRMRVLIQGPGLKPQELNRSSLKWSV